MKEVYLLIPLLTTPNPTIVALPSYLGKRYRKSAKRHVAKLLNLSVRWRKVRGLAALTQ